MANLYTDEARTARYDLCRKRADRCEKIFGGCMWVMLFIAVTEVLPQLARGLLYGLFIGELEEFAAMLLVTAVIAFAVYAMFRRDWRFLLGALAAAGLACSGFFMLFGYLSPIVLAVALIASFSWRRLEQEEGFPTFRILYEEQSVQEKLQVSRAHHRAVEAGTHTEQATLNVNAGMTDLLDEETAPLPAELKNYHERSRNADAVVQLPQPHGDGMDEL